MALVIFGGALIREWAFIRSFTVSANRKNMRSKFLQNIFISRISLILELAGSDLGQTLLQPFPSPMALVILLGRSIVLQRKKTIL